MNFKEPVGNGKAFSLSVNGMHLLLVVDREAGGPGSGLSTKFFIPVQGEQFGGGDF